MTRKRMMVLGGTGFVGREVVRHAAREGWAVTALGRSEAALAELRTLGARAVEGDAGAPSGWVEEARGAAALVDLVQPALPGRIGLRQIRQMARRRLEVSRAYLRALAALPDGERPRVVSVSGVDDLAPDGRGAVSHRSPLRERPVGFGHIGLAVRREVDSAGLPATHVHLGTVYGPGKAFAERILPALERRRQPVLGDGSNRVALVHVVDAARALVHLAGLEGADGRSFVVADGAGTTQRELLEHAASLLGAPPPRRIPLWLASLAAGRVVVEVMARDLVPDPSALLETGFAFRFPSHHAGMAATVEALRRAGRLRPLQPPEELRTC